MYTESLSIIDMLQCTCTAYKSSTINGIHVHTQRTFTHLFEGERALIPVWVWCGHPLGVELVPNCISVQTVGLHLHKAVGTFFVREEVPGDDLRGGAIMSV